MGSHSKYCIPNSSYPCHKSLSFAEKLLFSKQNWHLFPCSLSKDTKKLGGYFHQFVKEKVKRKILQWEKITNINHMFVMAVLIAFCFLVL